MPETVRISKTSAVQLRYWILEFCQLFPIRNFKELRVQNVGADKSLYTETDTKDMCEIQLKVNNFIMRIVVIRTAPHLNFVSHRFYGM
jgi:hypothetical protein